MTSAGQIKSITPSNAIPGGEVAVECTDLKISDPLSIKCFVGGQQCRLAAASNDRIIALVPEETTDPRVQLEVESDGKRSGPGEIVVGSKLADNMHIVANPAVDPVDGSIVLTRSGSRGQQLPETLFRLETDGYLSHVDAEILNPTGLAFDRDGALYITNRAEGEVVKIGRDDESSRFSAGLGVATGIAFDTAGDAYVGDRSGTIYRIRAGSAETFAVVEPSVSAYHMAFGPDERLYVSAPGLASYDQIYAIDPGGEVESYFRGFGRPQGLAFDVDGNLYVAACYKGKHGIVRIFPGAFGAEMFVSGMNLVGLCFTGGGDLIAATNEAVYSLPLGIHGSLLNS